MYLELVSTVAAVERDLARAYESSARMREVAQYFLLLQKATIAFFENVEPPERCKHLHETFMKWQRMGLEALSQELERGSVESELPLRYAGASRDFAEALEAFAKQSQAEPSAQGTRELSSAERGPKARSPMEKEPASKPV